MFLIVVSLIFFFFIFFLIHNFLLMYFFRILILLIEYEIRKIKKINSNWYISLRNLFSLDCIKYKIK